MGKQLKIKGGHIVLVNRKRPTITHTTSTTTNRKPSTNSTPSECITVCLFCLGTIFFLASIVCFAGYKFVAGLINIAVWGGITFLLYRYILWKNGISNRKKTKILLRETHLLEYPKDVKYYEHGEKLHPDSWYEEECFYCGMAMLKSENVCKYCGHSKIEREIIEKRSRHIPNKVKLEVWRRDYGKCVECGSKERLEYDHIIPFSKGGSNTARNIQLLCENCNRKKHNKIE